MTLHLSVRCSFQLVLARTGNCLPSPNSGIELILQVLSQPLKAICASCGNPHQFLLPCNQYQMPTDTRSWLVGSDADAIPSEAELTALSRSDNNASVQVIVIHTRKFDMNSNRITVRSQSNPDHFHEISMQAEIAAVLSQLHSILGMLQDAFASAFLYPSSTCRTKVEVDHDSTGFLDSTYRRVEDVLGLCSWQLDALHGGRMVREKVAASTRISKNNTFIVFPQAPSTLDPVEVLAWIDVVTQMVTCCQEAWPSLPVVKRIDGNLITPARFSPIDLLEHLRCKTFVMDRFNRALYQRRTDYDIAIGRAIVAVDAGNALGPLALHLANDAAGMAGAEGVRARIAARFDGGVYGSVSELYRRRVLESFDGERRSRQ